MADKGFFARIFGGGSSVDLWRRYERLREGVAGTMSQFYKVRDLQTGQSSLEDIFLQLVRA